MNKYFFLLLVSLCILSCSKELLLSDKQIALIKGEAKELLNGHYPKGIDLTIVKLGEIEKLNPKKVYATNHGLYIVLQSAFVSESGIFIPHENVNVDTSSKMDPLYKEMKNGIYWYSIKG